MDATKLKQKLFSETTRPRSWHGHPQILLPESLSPIQETLLFSGERRHRVLELGSGWGEFARAYLQEHPATDYVAFEIKPDRILQTLKYIEKISEAHFRILPVNFNWFLEEILPPSAFDLVVVNFPDPWPKRRHWKHRLIQASFPARIHPLMARGAELHIATDYGPYARKILRAFRDSVLFAPIYQNPDYRRERPKSLYPTKFERIQKSQGKHPYYMGFRKKEEAPLPP